MGHEQRHVELLERADARAEARSREIQERWARIDERSEARWKQAEERSIRTQQRLRGVETAFEEDRRLWRQNFSVMAGLVKAVEDLKKETRANRDAAFRLLDRFGEGGQPA